MKDMTVVLFDIDGTLVDMKGAGRKSFVRSLKTVFGWEDEIDYVDFAGNTDLNVLLQVARHHEHALAKEEQKAFFKQMPVELELAVKDAELLVYPGVTALLEALADRPEVILGLVTGNVAASARIKLQQFDLHNHFVLGAFGDDHADRMEIARLAIRRIENKMKEKQHIHRMFLIGDTPYDVLAAKTIAATSIAVATGTFDADALRKAGADHVLTDLSDTDSILHLLGL